MSGALRAAALALALAGAASAEPLAPPTDPLFRGHGAWGQPHEDQWAIRRVGFHDAGRSAWLRVDRSARPVVVAVVDTGLDREHPDLDGAALWRNPREKPGNGIDDDGNGFADDVIGWNFVDGDARPRDQHGHGTLVAGVIAARWNGVGIAGINPFARIMVLKALRDIGQPRESRVAEAIRYAADNGARVVCLGVPQASIGDAERLAIGYATGKGVLVVLGAGDDASDVGSGGTAGLESVLTVGATGLDDERAAFSSFGRAVDLVAPGVELLSLRAGGSASAPGAVGTDRRYARASGTSLSAAIVSGAASLVMASRPILSARDVKRMLLHSARELEPPGVDAYTGYGLLDARAALGADARFFVEAAIESAEVADGVLRVVGTADANAFAGARIELGAGEIPGRWRRVAKVRRRVRGGLLGSLPVSELAGQKIWTLRLIASHKGGGTREYRLPVAAPIEPCSLWLFWRCSPWGRFYRT